MHGQGHPVRAVTLGHCPQGPQGILQTRTQAGKVFPKTESDMLPVRMGQHEVIEQVRKRHPGNAHFQFVHRREIRCRQPTRSVNLREEHLLARALQRFPPPYPTLESPPQGVRILPRLRSLQPVPKCLGLQQRLLL
jgi:hypothetical protein